MLAHGKALLLRTCDAGAVAVVVPHPHLARCTSVPSVLCASGVLIPLLWAVARQYMEEEEEVKDEAHTCVKLTILIQVRLQTDLMHREGIN
ncbi:hypothetical protein E2C01_012372 [Portunus trituberculatus]|uniref:Uncharacterized protein n=1 Tax=Portunus trituberculatus TaxID=210409 RepID=A0A5B7DE12_PORTR|nr:hypothetical protein [Portunus trituberculatus]